ncbi:MAG TPA: cytochrome P450 [Thermoleophilaceae bacterium]|nr:cytochrome P450 [Thermoleophilaceae bacterium]
MTTTVALPGPPGSRLVGMAVDLRRDVLGTLLKHFNEYGDIVAYRLGPARPQALQRHAIAVHHPREIRRVFTQRDTFSRDTASYRVLAELFGQNLVTSNGDDWLAQKRTLQPLFARRSIEHQYTPIIEHEAETTVEREGRGAGTIDVARAMELYALRVLGYTLFKDEQGVDAETVDALERLVPVVGQQVRSRATQFVRVPLSVPTPGNRRFVATRKELYLVVDRFLAKQSSKSGDADQPDLLSQLRDAQDGDRPMFSPQDIRDQALIFLLSGHTTTSNALTSTIYLLASNPDVQEEVAVAAAGEPEDGDLVRAAVEEGLRLHPPSYVIGRRLAADTELDGQPISAGTNVLLSPWVTHRHPEFWDDPERFDPHRFTRPHDRPPYAYFPFGGGPRECIGRHFALLEATIMVRALLRRFRLEAVDHDVELNQLISIRPAGPVKVTCRPR